MDTPDAPIPTTDEAWAQRVPDPLAFKVTRHAATERAFTGAYWDHWATGRYHCVVCGQALFDSSSKFDAGCGWPSYSAPVAQTLVNRVDDHSHGMMRTEVRCARCLSHLGHVFPDGPLPTGERFCINSVSLTFEPTAEPDGTDA